METTSDDTLRAIRDQLLVRGTKLGESARGELRQIDRALERLEAGTYGTCETCGEKVDTEQLRVTPYSVACRRHCAPES